MVWQLEGQVAIVTGCASGIGLTTTRLYLEAGATVFGINISPFPDPSPLSEEISANFHFHRADLTAPGACDESAAACVSKTGRKVDVLANVAGIMDAFEAIHNLKDTTWESSDECQYNSTHETDESYFDYWRNARTKVGPNYERCQ
ncbi:uncharacterized protein PV07_10559 [Cladophialophora immunda]|uniref:Uncharacterized protein n=1 Tax=Cladophialophora immunda TaxID=569365 RepID=A0A0D2AIZ0_9EURO|nr:uncharacterized protein PV07_10559 [Cladophialophora immunda]KIW24872.1 hypothetical protein PV07_10559 [Cladophialophora immunda]OQU97767.1 hypothetical protein CLAIMM_03652 [Cladophialophora immunda]